jgi:hypothetical protein
MNGRLEHQLEQLGIVLPRPPRAIGNFVYGVEHAGLLYLSGTYGATVAANDRDYLPIAGKTGAAVFTSRIDPSLLSSLRSDVRPPATDTRLSYTGNFRDQSVMLREFTRAKTSRQRSDSWNPQLKNQTTRDDTT